MGLLRTARARLLALSAFALAAVVLGSPAVASPAVASPAVASPALAAPASATPTLADAATGAAGSTVTVGVKPLDPFVTKNPNVAAGGNDAYQGFSIDLWNEVAKRNSWTTTYRWYDTLPPMLADVKAGTVDAGIAGISITKDREQSFDFSYPMFNAGLEVLTTTSGSSSWTDELGGFVTAGIGRYLLALVAVLVLAGHVIWLATRRATGQSYLPGVGLGIYKAAGLGLSGDYGVGEPVRPWGRVVAVAWSIVGICFVALFTASVTSQLTVQTIQGSVRGVQDLGGRTVVTVEGTSAAAYLKKHDIAYTGVTTIEEAYPRLDAGEVDAIVFDAPVLEHRLQASGSGNEIVVGGIFAHEDYGIAMPTGSALRKKVNTALIDMRSDGTYDQLYSRYFGTGTGG